MTEKLTDEDLKLANGGGSGSIPSGGITMIKRSDLYSGHYYCDGTLQNVVYVYDTPASGSFALYTLENFEVSGNSWSSSSKSGADMDTKDDFKEKYPFLLNITP